MVVNQWSTIWWHSVTVVMVDSSSTHTEVTLTFPTSGMTRGTRVVAHIVFATSLTALVCMLMSGGWRTDYGGSIFTGYPVVMVSNRESMLMSTSSAVPSDVPEKALVKLSPALLETNVGMWRIEIVHWLSTPIRPQMSWLLSMIMRSCDEAVWHLFKGWLASFGNYLVI